jgi:hypothetical protein
MVSAGSGPAVSQCEPSGVWGAIVSCHPSHPQRESRLDSSATCGKWLRHDVLKNVFRFCRGEKPHRYLHMIRYAQPYCTVPVSKAIRVCMHVISPTNVRSVYSTVQYGVVLPRTCIVLVSLKGEPPIHRLNGVYLYRLAQSSTSRLLDTGCCSIACNAGTYVHVGARTGTL